MQINPYPAEPEETRSRTQNARTQCARQAKGKVTSYRVFIRVFLSYLFSFVNLASTLHAGVCWFVFFFFGATLRYIDRGRNHKSNWKTKDQPFPWKFVLTLPNSLTVQRPTLLHCKIRLPTTRSSLTSVIYKCRYLFSDSKTIATPVNYTCKSFIKLAPDKFKAPSTRI